MFITKRYIPPIQPMTTPTNSLNYCKQTPLIIMFPTHSSNILRILRYYEECRVLSQEGSRIRGNTATNHLWRRSLDIEKYRDRGEARKFCKSSRGHTEYAAGSQRQHKRRNNANHRRQSILSITQPNEVNTTITQLKTIKLRSISLVDDCGMFKQ